MIHSLTGEGGGQSIYTKLLNSCKYVCIDRTVQRQSAGTYAYARCMQVSFVGRRSGNATYGILIDFVTPVPILFFQTFQLLP
jgi:hypothetical protein